MKPNRKYQQCMDMNRLMQEKIYALAEDMAWRCHEAGLQVKDFHLIMGTNCLWASVKAFAACSKPTGDKELVKIFRETLKKTRKKR